MRFLIDRCAGRRLAEWLARAGHDVVESRLTGPDPGDEALLADATREQRILVTIDTDFGWIVFVQGVAHAGVVRLPDVPVPERIRLMGAILERHSQDLADGAIITVRGNKIRISRSA